MRQDFLIKFSNICANFHLFFFLRLINLLEEYTSLNFGQMTGSFSFGCRLNYELALSALLGI